MCKLALLFAASSLLLLINKTNVYPKVLQCPQQMEQGVVILTEDQARRFTTALSEIAIRGKVTIVVEASPFQPTLKALPDNIPQNQTTKVLIPWLAKAYDYTAELKNGVWVLRKKYTDSADVPAVTLAECYHSLNGMDRLMAKFHTRSKTYVTRTRVYHGDEQLNRKFMLSLSPEQLNRMRGALQGTVFVSPVPKEKALPIADLRPEQKQQLWQIVVGWHLQSAQDSVASTIAEMSNINAGAAFLYRQPLSDQNWGYETLNNFSNVPLNSTVFWSIPTRSLAWTNYFRNVRQPPAIRVRNLPKRSGVQIAALPEWTRRLAIMPTATHQTLVWDDVSGFVSTLGIIVSEVNKSTSSATERFTIDKALANKPVMLFGQENTSAEAVVRALGAVYDLRIIHLPDQPMLITFPATPECHSLADLSQSVWSQLPAPIRRSFKIDHVDLDAEQRHREENDKAIKKRFSQANTAPQQEEGPSISMMLRLQQGEIVAPEEVGGEMAKVLHQTLKSRTEAAPDQTLLVSELHTREEAAFATYLMAITCRDSGNFLKPEYPQYLSTFDRFYISGILGIVDHPDFYSFTLAAPHSDGKMVGGGSPQYGGAIEPEYTGKP